MGYSAETFQLESYEFQAESQAFVSAINIKNRDEDGMIAVSIGQAEHEKTIKWSTDTIMGVLGKAGGEAIAIISIVSVILAYYQQFAYQRDALKSNYYEVRPSDDDF